MGEKDMPRLVTDTKMPKILWYQTDCFVNMSIQLVDVDKFHLRIDRDQLLFNTIVDDSKYCIVLTFFGAVIPEKSRVTNTGREIRISIVKGHLGVDWLRLQSEQERNPMILHDLEKSVKKETKKILPMDWESGKLVEEYKRLNNVDHLLPDGPSSDDGAESDDEIFDTYFD